VLGDDASADRRLLQVAKIDKPNDSSMGSAEGDRQLAEVLVEGDEYLAVLRCVGEDLVVAWIGAPVSDPLYLVPGALEFCFCSRPDAAIEQELQAASSVTAGSTRS